METNITPRRASGLAPPSREPLKPTTRPLLLDVRIDSKRVRAAREAPIPNVLKKCTGCYFGCSECSGAWG